MKMFKKLASVVLISSMLIGTVAMTAGCKSLKQSLGGVAGEVKTVAESDTWYDTQRITLNTGYEDNEDVDYIDSSFVAKTDTQVIMRINGYYKIDDSAYDSPDFDYNDYAIDEIAWFNFDGTKTDTISVVDIMASADLPETAYSYVSNIIASIDSLYVQFEVYDDESFESQSYCIVIDLATKQASEAAEVDNGLDDGESVEQSVVVGDNFTINTVWVSGDTSSYIIYVTDKNGNTEKLDFRDLFPSYDIFDISHFVMISENEVLMPASMGGDAGGTKYFVLNLDTYDVTEEDMQWITDADIQLYTLAQMSDGSGCYSVDDEAIMKLNFEEGTVETVYDFNTCNMDRSELSSMTLLSCTDEQIVMIGSVYHSNAVSASTSECIMYTFTKAETNPNAGKTIIDVASVDYWPASILTSVFNFNQTSEDYYVLLNNDYLIDNYVDSSDEADSQEDYVAQQLESTSALSDQLAIDIMAGEGPDILLDGANYTQLNNSNYFLDLNDYLNGSEGVNADDYFSNLFDAFETNEALYQMPLSVALNGILVDSADIDDGQVGFTFEQYEEFVDDVCNGTDPNSYANRNSVFLECFATMADLFFTEDGDLNLEQDAFYDLADFCRDNYEDEFPVYEDGYYEVTSGFQAQKTSMYSFMSYMDQVSYSTLDSLQLLGLPSSDARGVSVTADVSVAISSQSASADGAWNFVSYLLGEEAQIRFAENYGTPVLRSAFDSNAHTALDAYNEMIEENASYYSEEEAREYGIRTEPFDESLIDTYASFVSNASVASAMDSAVSMVLNEEMPAYYAGQKSIDEVIAIIISRAQTIIDERG